MNNFDPEQFEAELKRLRPAKPPKHVVDRLITELSLQPAQPSQGPWTQRGSSGWPGFLRWLIPSGAMAVLCIGLFLKYQAAPTIHLPSQRVAVAARPVLKADQVEIDRQLLADFDAVAKLPSGEPVRFRCEQWLDKIRWRDSAKGLVVEQASPRLEIVPVRFETY